MNSGPGSHGDLKVGGKDLEWNPQGGQLPAHKIIISMESSCLLVKVMVTDHVLLQEPLSM